MTTEQKPPVNQADQEVGAESDLKARLLAILAEAMNGLGPRAGQTLAEGTGAAYEKVGETKAQLSELKTEASAKIEQAKAQVQGVIQETKDKLKAGLEQAEEQVKQDFKTERERVALNLKMAELMANDALKNLLERLSASDTTTNFLVLIGVLNSLGIGGLMYNKIEQQSPMKEAFLDNLKTYFELLMDKDSSMIAGSALLGIFVLMTVTSAGLGKWVVED